MATEHTSRGVKYLYTPFLKVDDEQRTVTGIASGFSEDLDGEGIDPEWLKQEFTDWYNRFGNVREMHQLKAVGTGIDMDWDEQGRPVLTAHIVDDDAWKKVKEGVYKGMSIGIKGTKKVADERYRNGRINGGKIIETSVVDRPCNDEAVFTHVKSVLAEEKEDGTWIIGSASTNGEGVNNKVADDNKTLNGNDSDEARRGRVQTALDNLYRDYWIHKTFPDAVIVSDWNDGCFYMIPYEDDGERATLGEREKVEHTFTPISNKGALTDVQKAVVAGQHMASLIAQVGKAVWTQKYIDDLPDSSFAYIGDDGKRHLPFKDKDGKVDKAHVDNALARLDQTDIPEEAKDKAKEKLDAAAKEVDDSVNDDKNNKGASGDDKHPDDCDCKTCMDSKADDEKSALADAKKAAWHTLMALGTDTKKAASTIDAADMTVLTDIAALAERMALQTDEDHDGDIDFAANLEPQIDSAGLTQTKHVDETELENRIMGKAAAIIEEKMNEFSAKFATIDSGKASSVDAETTKAVNELKLVSDELKARVETMENTVVNNTVKTVAIERHVGMGGEGSPQPQSWQDAMNTLTQKASQLDDSQQRDLTADMLKMVYGQNVAR